MGDWGLDWGGVADALDEADLGSLWSPTALRAEPNWQFTMPSWSFDDIDFSTIADVLGDVDLSDFDTSNLNVANLSNLNLDNLVNTDYIDTSDFPTVIGGREQSVMNQINPNVQTYLKDPVFGQAATSLSSPVRSAIDPAYGGYFSLDPEKYYGLFSPKLSDTARAKLYEGINFATEGGVKMFARRLAAATNDNVSMQTPDGGTVTAEPNGRVTKKAPAKKTTEAASTDVAGGGGQGGGQGGAGAGAGGAGAGGAGGVMGGGGGMSPLVAMGLLGGLASMLTTGGSQQPAAAPIKTVRDIPAAPGGLNIFGRGEVPYGQASAPVSLDPNLARNLGAPMRQGGLMHSIYPAVLAHGGRTDYSHGAPVSGEGSGQDDKIPALLSDGEYVIDADTVAALGDGSNKEGAKLLDEFRQIIRSHKRSAPDHKIPPKAKSPLQYLKEAKHG